MKKKVCIFGFLKMGIGHYIAHLYKEIKNDFNISVISYSHGALNDRLIIDDEIIKNNISNYKLIVNPHGFREAFHSINQLFDFFNKNQFDIFNLHVSAYTRLTSYLFIPLIEYFRKKGLRILYTIHDVLPFPEGEKPSNFLGYFYNLADTAIVGNKQEQKNLKNIFCFRKKIYIAPHGIYSLFNRNKITKKQALKKLNLKEEQNKMLFFGILRKNKGLDDLIKAVNVLKQQKLKNSILLIAVSLRSGIKFDEYQNLINKFKLNTKIKVFLKDSFSINEIETFFKASDLVVLPYTNVSQSGILNLAFAFEKPVIVSNFFAEKKIIENKLGFVTPAKDPKKLAEKIIYFFKDKMILISFFQKNIKNYNKNHSFSRTAEVYKKAFNNLLEKNKI